MKREVEEPWDSRSRARVLTVLLDVPTPPVTGFHLRQLAILRLVRDLGCESNVLLFTTADRPQVPHDLSELCEHLVVAGPRVEYATMDWSWRAKTRLRILALSLWGRPSGAYPFSLPYDEAGAVEKILGAAREVHAEVVVLPTVLAHVAQKLQAAGIRVIGDAADIMSELTRRLALRCGVREPWRLPGVLANHVATTAQEARYLRCFDELWASSRAEADTLGRMVPGAVCLVAGNVLAKGELCPSPIPDEGPIGFIGNLSLAPNLDAAKLLARRVLPRVRAQLPGARLALAGRGMPAGVERQLASCEGVDILGPVKDSVEFMRRCRVMALPVRVRGGVPLKLVEALGVGRPVVASPQLVNGLPLGDSEQLLVGHNTRTFGCAIVSLMSDDALAQELARCGRRCFEKEFSYEGCLAEMEAGSLLGGARACATSRSSRNEDGDPAPD